MKLSLRMFHNDLAFCTKQIKIKNYFKITMLTFKKSRFWLSPQIQPQTTLLSWRNKKKCQDKCIWHISNPESRVRCFNHVLNLAVQDFMKGIRATDSRKRKRRSVEENEDDCSSEEGSVKDELT